MIDFSQWSSHFVVSIQQFTYEELSLDKSSSLPDLHNRIIGKESTLINQKEIEVSGIISLVEQVETMNQTTIEALIPGPNHIYKVSTLLTGDPTTDSTRSQTFDQILSTFRFIEDQLLDPSLSLADPGEWKIFLSNSNDYQISYPPNWVPFDEYLQNNNAIFKISQPDSEQEQFLLGVTASPLNTNQNLNQIVNRIISSQENSSEIRQENLHIDGRPAIQLVGREERFPLIEIITVKDDRVYKIWAQPYDSQHPQWGKFTPSLDKIFHSFAETFTVLP